MLKYLEKLENIVLSDAEDLPPACVQMVRTGIESLEAISTRREEVIRKSPEDTDRILALDRAQQHAVWDLIHKLHESGWLAQLNVRNETQ